LTGADIIPQHAFVHMDDDLITVAGRSRIKIGRQRRLGQKRDLGAAVAKDNDFVSHHADGATVDQQRA
jgi:hypothetical protein